MVVESEGFPVFDFRQRRRPQLFGLHWSEPPYRHDLRVDCPREKPPMPLLEFRRQLSMRIGRGCGSFSSAHQRGAQRGLRVTGGALHSAGRGSARTPALRGSPSTPPRPRPAASARPTVAYLRVYDPAAGREQPAPRHPRVGFRLVTVNVAQVAQLIEFHLADAMNRAAPGRDPRSGPVLPKDFDLIDPNPYGRPVAELDGHGLLAGGAALPGQALAFGVREGHACHCTVTAPPARPRSPRPGPRPASRACS